MRDTYHVLVGNIVINPDRTIDVSSIVGHYKWAESRLDTAAIPTHGYFTIVFELIWGQNNINSWNSVNIYIDGTKVFKGYTMGGTIGNVSITCNPVTTGATLDIDNFRIGLGNYSPNYLTATPAAGIIPAGESVAVNVSIDPASLEYRTYNQNIVAHIDEADSIIIPVTFDVTGKPWLAIQAPISMDINRDRGDEEVYLLNMGGTDIQFEAQGVLSYLYITPASGTIMREGVVILRVGSGLSIPGAYSDTLKITANIEGFPVFYAPVSIQIDPPEEYETTFAQSDNGQSEEDPAVIPGTMTLSPNPAETNGLVTLQIPDMDVAPAVVQILVISTTGQVAYTAQEVLKNSQTAFTVTNAFKPGVYLVILRQGQKKYSKRLLIK